MNKSFEEERQFVLDMAKQGIDININLSSKQKKYIKNLLLFALMGASTSTTVDKNFVETVNKLFKTYLIKILKESLDDDEDWEDDISVELNKIIAGDSLKNLADLQEIFTPYQIFSFMKKYTKDFSQKDLLMKLKALKDAKRNEEDEENEEKEKKKKKKELLEEDRRNLSIKLLRGVKTNQRETPDEQRKREQNIREYERQRTRERGRGARTR